MMARVENRLPTAAAAAGGTLRLATTTKTVAILPVKRFSAAKQRLDGDLSDGTRRALAEAMVTDVLIALRRARRVDEVIVVSGEDAAAALAAGFDASAVVDDPDDAGHSAAAEPACTRHSSEARRESSWCPATVRLWIRSRSIDFSTATRAAQRCWSCLIGTPAGPTHWCSVRRT